VAPSFTRLENIGLPSMGYDKDKASKLSYLINEKALNKKITGSIIGFTPNMNVWVKYLILTG
jgi:hypothetical protein